MQRLSECVRFFRFSAVELRTKFNNNRAWFQANKATYDRDVRGPFESLLDELADEFGEGTMSRPNRDVRFSKDKSPYKLQAYVRVARPGGGGGRYLGLRDEGLFVGGGLYMPDREHLARIRGAIADDRSGAELETIVDGLTGHGMSLMEDGALKTAPRGFATEHPRIRLLRLPHLAAGVLHPPGRWLHTAAAKDRVVEGWRRIEPLLEWQARYA